MMGTKCICAVAIAAACVFLQVEVAHSFFGFSQGQDKDAAVPQPGQAPAHPGHHAHGFHSHHQQTNMQNGFQAQPQHHGMMHGGIQAFTGGVKQAFSKFANFANPLAPQPKVLAYLPLTRATFYDQCGTAVRHCEWANAAKVGKKFVTVEEDDAASPSMKQVCFVSKHVCVGNTETCVSSRDCDVAMKITEVTREGGKHSTVVSVSHINNCEMESQSVTDVSRTSQMLFGIGFATYDAEGKVECRPPKASDFKLVFLWKNSSSELTGKGSCKPLEEKDVWKSLKTYDHDLMQAFQNWPKVCKSAAADEGSFNFKNFLEKQTPTIHFTSFFAPPFDFAANYETQFSSNGMVISGTVA
ncbi:unnamed protein product [Orchesella dallaii]|uniref:Uncharacterized protein n=1 Tax=Orchesella dallaii TaxID=48710 RepID=A0ABP1RN92_9HEXA